MLQRCWRQFVQQCLAVIHERLIRPADVAVTDLAGIINVLTKRRTLIEHDAKALDVWWRLNDSAGHWQTVEKVNASPPGGKLSYTVFWRIEWEAVIEQPFTQSGCTHDSILATFDDISDLATTIRMELRVVSMLMATRHQMNGADTTVKKYTRQTEQDLDTILVQLHSWERRHQKNKNRTWRKQSETLPAKPNVYLSRLI